MQPASLLSQISFGLRAMFWPRRADLPDLNRAFLPLIVIAGGIFGSALSIFIVGSMLWAMIQLARPVHAYTRDKDAWKIAACFALFFAAELVSGLANFNGQETILEIVENLPFLGFLPLYSLILAPRDEIRDAIEKGAIAGAFIVCGLAVYQSIYLLQRPEGGAGNSGVFAVMCVLLYAITFLTLLHHHGAKRTLAGLATLAAACAVLLSGTRALWPALILIPIVAILICRGARNFQIRKTFLIMALFFLGLAGLALYAPVKERVFAARHDFDQLQERNYHTSLGQRIVTWKAGLALIAEKPLLGHGPGAAKDLMAQKTKELSGYRLGYSHFHNFVLTAWVRSGLAGVLAILAIFVMPLLLAMKKLDDETSVYGFALLVCVELVYLMSGSFGIMFGHDIMDTVFVGTMVIALYMVFQREEKPLHKAANAA